jgi:hypothetical protein
MPTFSAVFDDFAPGADTFVPAGEGLCIPDSGAPQLPQKPVLSTAAVPQ